MNHQKEEVLPKASTMWPDILVNLAGIDASILDHRKEHPCPLCGGKTRFRYRSNQPILDRPFYCNQCGSKNGIEFFISYTGMDYGSAINSIGNYLGNIPQDQLEMKKREFDILSRFPSWYDFDHNRYDFVKKTAKVDLSSWQRVNGLNMIDILKSGDDAIVPLLYKDGKPIDFVMIDVDGNYQTTAGNTIIPCGFHSVFGEIKGKRLYIAVYPEVAAHASIFTQRQVICCYSLENIWEIGKHFEDPPLVIVSNIEEVREADSIKFSQLVFNRKNHTVNRRMYKPFEIIEERNKKK